ncbi:MAG: hypothetical protein WBA91_14610, partial [Paracoccaceae bacterium]
MNVTNPSGHQVLFAASLVSFTLGSIHAFSIFLAPIEAAFGASRAVASLTYSLALVFLTIAVLFGPALYLRLRPATIFVLTALLGAAGAAVAGLAGSVAQLWLGYGLLFGLANGLGYGYGLQFAARANPGRVGFAMGTVTAAYALGAALAPYGFAHLLAVGGFAAAMAALAAAVFLVGLGAALLVARSGA